MPTIPEALALGKSYHLAGRLRDAEEMYRSIVRADPANAEAFYLLGTACGGLGNTDDAITSLAQAVRLQPNYAAAHQHLGVLLAETGKAAEAAACFRRALELEPDFIRAHHNLGILLLSQARSDEAAECFRRAIQLRPDFAEAHHNLAAALTNLEQFDQAASCCRRAIQLKPNFIEAHNNLAGILRRQGYLEEGVIYCRRAVELKPDFAEAHYNLGATLQLQGELDEAAACFRRAIALKPDGADAHNDLGTVLVKLGEFVDAIACFSRAIELRPDFIDAVNNLGAALTEHGNLDEAAACFQQIIRLNPDHAEAHYNYALALLMMGRLDEGWSEFEWRFKYKGKQERALLQPRWRRDSPAGCTIMLHCEQGLGDTLHFIRYAKLVQKEGLALIIEVQRPLMPLLTQSGFPGLIPKNSPLPDFDVHAPLMSLPGIFRTTLESIPGSVPYLSADPQLEEQWRATLGTTGKFRVGIAWQGNPTYDGDKLRSIPLVHFSPLAQVGVELVSLQKDFGGEQLSGIRDKFHVRDFGANVDQEHGAFMDTAAIMKNLDLVVTCDSVLARLAGALGVPVWVPLSRAPDWRWMLKRADSPWYPTMRLFRQTVIGNWGDVFQSIQRELLQVL